MIIYKKFEFSSLELAQEFISTIKTTYPLVQCTEPTVLPLTYSEPDKNGNRLPLTYSGYLVDAIGIDWVIPEIYLPNKVTPTISKQMIAGMENYYNPEI